MEILMVRPFQFYFNQQTAVNNFFQSNINIENANELAIAEFDAMVEQLRAHQIKVKVVQDTKDPSTPDSIFPNNWISTHPDGTLCLYPMYAENRRAERKLNVIEFLQANYKIENLLDLTDFEKEGKFLEGTGSMVLDHQNKMAYGCLSERLNKEAFTYWCDKMQFKPISFKAEDNKAQPIYHTNVMMCMGNQFVVICLESIPNELEKQNVLESFLQTNKEVITISQDQLNHFAGNMLQVFDLFEKPHLIMSKRAYTSLHVAQLKSLEKYNTLIPISIPTIEALGGGSTRCMMAEIYLSPA
ncbi:MAG: amidinotransferase [Chitinophagaceae bacterium]|nr:amidinotransferase [Chitinophagaceae bacterium]MCF8289161.1 amidinotransferase [Chitinophagaceae bacterium]MCF8421303.1 amidinotransferase [Chitinophagaceae bacterium]